MNISPSEAEEALTSIQAIAKKTRQSIGSGGTYITLIVTGIVWLVGFLSTQFLGGNIVVYIWVGLSILGSIVGTVFGIRMGKRVRSPGTAPMAKRIGLFWTLLILFGVAVIAIAQPTDGKQVAMLVILLIMLGQMAMGLVFSFSSTWWALLIAGLAVAGYYLLPEFFYLWMALLGGGGMIALGLHIRYRW
jgi:hypothetical protein